MKAVCYRIKSKISGDVVDEGIISHIEDSIYPAQNTGIVELPYECEAHHFKSSEYDIEFHEFEIVFDEKSKKIKCVD